jgi:hypothetical protein
LSLCRSNGHKKKKKLQQATVPEGDEEEDDDDTDTVSTASEFADDEKYVAKALRNSLGNSDHDPDVAEAKKRLLASTLFNDSVDYGPAECVVVADVESGHKNDTGSQGRNWSGYSIGGPERGSESDHRDTLTTEKTFLLAPSDGGSSFVEALRPSLFTTIASVAEIEKRTEGKGAVNQARVAEHDDQAESDHHRDSPMTERLLFEPPDIGSSFTEVLRPSIFTTIASIAEIEEHMLDEGTMTAFIAEAEEHIEEEGSGDNILDEATMIAYMDEFGEHTEEEVSVDHILDEVDHMLDESSIISSIAEVGEQSSIISSIAEFEEHMEEEGSGDRAGVEKHDDQALVKDHKEN